MRNSFIDRAKGMVMNGKELYRMGRNAKKQEGMRFLLNEQERMARTRKEWLEMELTIYLRKEQARRWREYH